MTKAFDFSVFELPGGLVKYTRETGNIIYLLRHLLYREEITPDLIDLVNDICFGKVKLRTHKPDRRDFWNRSHKNIMDLLKGNGPPEQVKAMRAFAKANTAPWGTEPSVAAEQLLGLMAGGVQPKTINERRFRKPKRQR